MSKYGNVPRNTIAGWCGQRYGWQVKKNGRRISKHTKKSAAKRKARQKAGMNDSVILHRLDGTAMG